MKKNIILKSFSYLLMVVMLYMHVCSALCATGVKGCCDKGDSDNDNCCEHEKGSDSRDHDCQDIHFAFFNTTGQFSQVKTDILFNTIQPLFSVDFPSFTRIAFSESKSILPYNGFHPPPPKPDIRISMQSFQI